MIETVRKLECFVDGIMRLALSLILLFLMTGMQAFAQTDIGVQDSGRRDLTLGEIMNRTLQIQTNGGNELTALDVLRDLGVQYADLPVTFRRIASAAYNFDARIGNYRDALSRYAFAHEPPRYQPLQSANEFPLRNLHPEPAIAVIESLADSAQIVMINEVHYGPQSRVVIHALLPLLWKKGFRYFAAEALGEADTHLAERGYPTAQTGFYTQEPLYGDLIRTALRLGYRVVPYDSIGNEREQKAAQNLFDRIFRTDAHAKVLVQAGPGHTDEDGKRVTLARRLKELTGIDPLTIDQHFMREQTSEEYEQPIYRYLMAHSPVSQPTIFLDADHHPWALQPGVRDISVFSPRSHYVNGRPTWLALGGARKAWRMPRSICGAARRCLVKARLAQEPADAIPIDQVEVIAHQRAPALMLPPGKFVLEVQDAIGKTLQTRDIRQH